MASQKKSPRQPGPVAVGHAVLPGPSSLALSGIEKTETLRRAVEALGNVGLLGDDRCLPCYHSGGRQQRLPLTAAQVTHDQSEALAVSGRIIVIDDRLIARPGTQKDMRERPASESVAGFVVEAMLLLRLTVLQRCQRVCA